MHSHHSHSGQFSQHAKNTLEQMVLRAIELGFTKYCLTEHIARLDLAHLYPEEVASNTTVSDLETTFDKYYHEAQRIKAKYRDQIELYVGFEAEALNPQYLHFSQSLLEKYNFDMFVGSLHHVNEIPIDFNRELWDDAMESAGGIEEMYSAYFDQQYAMIEALSPPVIGHFDLIRLFSPQFDLKSSKVWSKVLRNIDLGVQRGSLFEINSAALRKGWNNPYPQLDIAQAIVDANGMFCLSDDAHSIEQVGLNYDKLVPYLKTLGISAKSISGIEVNFEDLDAWVKRDNL